MIQSNTTDLKLVMSYHRMRIWVGVLGIALPILLPLLNMIINENNFLANPKLIFIDCHSMYQPDGNFKSSISHYYYSTVGELFVGTLCAVSFFLFCYKGYAKKQGEFMPGDSFTTNLAGIAALGVAIFPTSDEKCIVDNLRRFTSSELIGYVHYGFAGIFFACLCVMCFVNFRRTRLVADFGKMPSHNFYLVCGWGILASIMIILLYSFTSIGKLKSLETVPVIYIFETTALFFFGASWIKKGLIASN